MGSYRCLQRITGGILPKWTHTFDTGDQFKCIQSVATSLYKSTNDVLCFNWEEIKGNKPTLKGLFGVIFLARFVVGLTHLESFQRKCSNDAQRKEREDDFFGHHFPMMHAFLGYWIASERCGGYKHMLKLDWKDSLPGFKYGTIPDGVGPNEPSIETILRTLIDDVAVARPFNKYMFPSGSRAKPKIQICGEPLKD